MKILLGYDGSDCARAAVDDLLSAGLPAEAELKILSVQESWMPPPSSYEVFAGSNHALEAFAHAQEAAVALRSAFPQWDITPESETGSPSSVLLTVADHWKPELIIIGSHGRSALGRFFLGSVSQKLINEAHCSVRVARGRVQEPDTPLRVLLGVDGSSGAGAAIAAVAARNWPANTEVRLVNATWELPPMASEHAAAALTEWAAHEKEQVQTMLTSATQQLAAAGLKVSSIVKEQDPKQLLCEEAEKWGADCIFVGAKGISKLERLLIGSVSAAVASRAHCSVEIVRLPT